MSFIKANLISKKRIDVVVFTNMGKPDNLFFKVFKNDVQIPTKIIRQTSVSDTYLYSLEMLEEFEYGKSYSLLMTDFPTISVDVSGAVNLADFDDEFYYDGDDLGAIYTKKCTKYKKLKGVIK